MSYDGINWNSDIQGGNSLLSIVYAKNKFVVVGQNGRRVLSVDGINWTNDITGGTDLRGITYGNDIFVAVGNDGRTIISSDGIIYISTEIDEVYGGQIYAINPDGTLRWRKIITNLNSASSPSIAEDGTIYIGSWWITEGEGGFGCLSAFNDFTGSNNPPDPPIFDGPSALFFLDPACVIDVKAVDSDMHPVKLILP